MGIFDSFRRSPASTHIRMQLKASSFEVIRRNNGDVLDAFRELITVFRTDIEESAGLNVHASEAREYYVLTFYYGAIAYLWSEYSALRIVHLEGLYALYLMSNAGATQEQAVEIAPKMAETAEGKLQDVASHGANAMCCWLEKNDTCAAALSFIDVCEMASKSGL